MAEAKESSGGMQIEAYMGLDKLIKDAQTRDALLTMYLDQDMNTLHGATAGWQTYTLPTNEVKEQDLMDVMNVWTQDVTTIAFGLPFQQFFFGLFSGIFGRSRRVEQSFVDKAKYVQENSQRVAGVEIKDIEAKYAPRHENPKFIYYKIKGADGNVAYVCEFDGPDADKITTFPPFPEYLKAEADEEACEPLNDAAMEYGTDADEPAKDNGADYCSNCPALEGFGQLKDQYADLSATVQQHEAYLAAEQ